MTEKEKHFKKSHIERIKRILVDLDFLCLELELPLRIKCRPDLNHKNFEHLAEIDVLDEETGYTRIKV